MNPRINCSDSLQNKSANFNLLANFIVQSAVTLIISAFLTKQQETKSNIDEIKLSNAENTRISLDMKLFV
jgi:hypothetical protein